MSPDAAMAMLVNDLDNIGHRLEALPGHPKLTSALLAVQLAKESVAAARTDMHVRGIESRHVAKAVAQAVS